MRKFIALSLALVLTSSNAFRGDDAADARNAVQRAFEAHGGIERLSKLKSFVRSAKGEITSFGGTLPATFETSANLPDQSRWAFELDAGNQKIAVTLVLNGDKGWQTGAGALKEMTAQQLEEQREEGYLLWLTTLAPLREPGFDFALLPEIKVANDPAVGVKVTRKGKPDIKLYFDKKTGLLVKAERKGKEAGVDVTKEYFFSEHKPFDNLKLPTKQLELKNGKKDAEWTISGYKIGRVDEGVFGKP